MSDHNEIPKTMFAIQISRAGGPEVLELNEIPVPIPKSHEVLIKVQWTGTNTIDIYVRNGLYPVPMPFTLGGGFVGTIVALPTEHATRTILPPLQLGMEVFSMQGGAFAQYAVAPAFQVAPLPDGVCPQEGVHMTIPAITAMYLTKESYTVKKGDWALVRSAGGGVGLLLVQLIKHFGGNVIGTTSSPTKVAVIKEAGADHVLLTTTPAAANIKSILDITGGKGVEVVYDGVGRDTWEENFEVVRKHGTIASYGNSSGPVPPFAPLKLMPKALKLTRPMVTPFIEEPEDFERHVQWIFDAVKEGGLKFSIHKIYPFTLEGVAQSQEDVQSRKTTGKLVIKVSD